MSQWRFAFQNRFTSGPLDSKQFFLYKVIQFFLQNVTYKKLDSNFLSILSKLKINKNQKIKDAGGTVISVICDDNIVNQPFVKTVDLIYP